MTAFVGLDPAATSELVRRFDEAAANLEAHAQTVAGLLAQGGVSSRAPAEMREVASWARYRSRDLRSRIDKIVKESGGGTALELRGFRFASRNHAKEAGRDEAKRVERLLRSHDTKKLNAALDALKHYGNDPAYVAAFFKGLGPARVYALLTATAGHDIAAVVGEALALARRSGGITVKFIDGIITAARKAAAAVQAYTGAIPKELRVQYAQDEYARRSGSQHPDLVKYLEAIEPLTPYLEAGTKVAVIGGAVVIVTGAVAGAFLSAGASVGPTIEVLAGSAPIDSQALQELEPLFSRASITAVEADASTGTIWDSIVATQPAYEGTALPRSFVLDFGEGGRVWVAPNASEHILERTIRLPAELQPVQIQSMLNSLKSAVEAANERGIVLGKLTQIGGWELVFDAPKPGEAYPVLLHALYRG